MHAIVSRRLIVAAATSPRVAFSRSSIIPRSFLPPASRTIMTTLPQDSSSIPASSTGARRSNTGNSGPTIHPSAEAFLQYVNASPTPFHAIGNAVAELEKAGFERVSERARWVAGEAEGSKKDAGSGGEEKDQTQRLSPGGKYFYTRNQSSILAFTLPHTATTNAQGGRSPGVAIVAGHSDSPRLIVRPVSKKERGGYLMVECEVYGGLSPANWFDRDLSLAGRVIVRSTSSPATFSSRLIKIDRPLMRIPSLAIHLDRELSNGITVNKETNMTPILGLVQRELNGTGAEKVDVVAAKEDDSDSASAMEATMSTKHHPTLVRLIANELDVQPEDIHDFELSLYDTQPACVGGIENEFIFSPRLDNQMTCFTALDALIASSGTSSLLPSSDKAPHVRAICLFDNEEVGSVSYQGAESSLLPGFVERIAAIDGFWGKTGMDVGTLMANSFLISSDMGHALNPNYEGKYQDNHKPLMNAGPIVKVNANQRYTSNAATTFLTRLVAHKAGVPLQFFEVRNDSSCGSTIGPGLSTHLRTVDVGLAQLSMHSIRETCGSKDPTMLIKMFKAFFDHFSELDQQLSLD